MAGLPQHERAKTEISRTRQQEDAFGQVIQVSTVSSTAKGIQKVFSGVSGAWVPTLSVIVELAAAAPEDDQSNSGPVKYFDSFKL